MGYKIQYRLPLKAELKLKERTRKRLKRIYTAILMIVTFVAAVCFFRTETAWDYLLPGDSAVTQAALNEFIANVREGESVKNAVTAFCREIIGNPVIP